MNQAGASGWRACLLIRAQKNRQAARASQAPAWMALNPATRDASAWKIPSASRAAELQAANSMKNRPGGAILPAYDPLLDSKVRHVLCRHEQGAGHAAEGYAWATGKVGVAIATSGPGGCNLVTPLADAKMDSVPMVAITGQVAGANHRRLAVRGRRHDQPQQRSSPLDSDQLGRFAAMVSPTSGEAFVAEVPRTSSAYTPGDRVHLWWEPSDELRLPPQ